MSRLLEFIENEARSCSFEPRDRGTDTRHEVLSHILKSGNMGHKNDVSYRGKFPAIVSNIITFWRRFIDFASLVPVFPIDPPKFFLTYVMKRVQK